MAKDKNLKKGDRVSTGPFKTAKVVKEPGKDGYVEVQTPSGMFLKTPVENVEKKGK